MKQVPINVKQFNPTIEETIMVSQYETVIEAVDALGMSNILAIINREKVNQARRKWREDNFKRYFPKRVRV